MVLYHAGCADGFCAAWVARKAIPNAEFVPVQYGQEPPDVKGRHVFLLDFSYKRPVMLAIAGAAASLTVLDHHKTAQKELEGFAVECGTFFALRSPTVVFDMDKSGGRLAWDHFNPAHHPRPWLVDYTEDRDLWRWKLDWSKEISACIASYDFSFEQWDRWAMIGPGCGAWDMLVTEGSAILRWQEKVVRSHVKVAGEIEMDGHKVLAVNTTVLHSEIGEVLAQGRAFGATWFDRNDGVRVWSLRSREGGIDVSEVAKKRGGGGHRQAAGFQVPQVTCGG